MISQILLRNKIWVREIGDDARIENRMSVLGFFARQTSPNYETGLETSTAKRNQGFTLLELILVITIISTISIMSVAFYARFFQQNDVSNITEQIVGQIRKAQIYAMAGKQSGSNWGVNYATGTLTLYKGNTFATRDSAFDEIFTVNTNVAVTGLSEINFAHATGLPNTTPTINVTFGSNANTITINSQGVVSR